ncbi:efflux RND transporter permease subunit, partial [Candidatus Auribacterota bacterium]
LTKYFIEHPKLSNLLLIFIVFAGIISMRSLPRQDMPNIDFNIMMVYTFYPGASPEDVEINVTDPIEDELENVDGIDEMSSFSIEGMSYIVLKLDPDSYEVSQIKDDIRSAIDRVANLPIEVEDRPLIKELKSTDFPVLEVAIVGDMTKEAFLRKITKDLESEIKTIGDVGSVEKIGYRKREVKILCDAKKMQQNYVSFADVLAAIKSHNVKLSGGTLESFVDEKKIVTFSEFENPLDVGKVILRSNFSGKHIEISNVAEIKDSYKKRDIFCRTNAINSINLIVKRRGTSDVINLSNDIDKVVSKYKDRFKDYGIDIIKVVDYSYYTRSLLKIVTKNALIGFVLVVFALFAFLNFHSAFWVGISIPISVFAAYICLPFFGITTDQVTLITMIVVLGMLVDDAIVIAENINRHQEEGMDYKEAALVGTREVFLPVTATISTTILCFIPIYFMKGILGKFIVAIPTVVILTLCMSLFESITMLPYHLSRKKMSKVRKNRWLDWLRSHYEGWLRSCLRHRFLTLFTFFLVFVLSIAFFIKKSRFDLFPTENFDLFYITMETPLGNSLEETAKKVQKIEDVVSRIPQNLMMGFKTIVGDHRTDEAASDPTLHANWALITVFLHPSSERDKRSEDIILELKEEMKDFTGFDKLEVRELQDGPPVGEPITIRLVSDDFKLCETYEQKIIKFLKNMKGVFALETTNREGKEEIRLRLNYKLMAQSGITAVDLAGVIRVAYDGRVATTIRRDGEEIDFRVKLQDDQRGNIDVLKELQVPNMENRLIKVEHIAKFEYGVAKETITHFKGKKAVIITGKVEEKSITSGEANKRVREMFEKEIKAIPGLDILFGGEEKETMESMQNFYVAFACGILGIYFILVLLLNSFFQPFLIMSAIPFGVVGVLVAFYIHGLPLSFIGMIGSLGMMGVVVNDSLVMVTYLNSLRKKHDKVDTALIIEGAKTRLRPVLLTTITTVLGLLPTVYGWGGTEPFLIPMVLAMSWGLAFATVITLVLIPTLYTFSRRGFSY